MWRKHSLGLFVAVVSSLGVFAQARAGDPATDAQNKVLAKRAAEADCYLNISGEIMSANGDLSYYGVKLMRLLSISFW